ncbi:hybrid sensor and regulator fused protein [Nitzschia inconspicua]|uniref:histidine kinase n=1 Tax=Nitzschia inconspicua TaxID=303405 RepID=A0A9K3KQX4_9STRA|nr:hybrid sensor and regulator fused protein [Nitzschia inconspicua]
MTSSSGSTEESSLAVQNGDAQTTLKQRRPSSDNCVDMRCKSMAANRKKMSLFQRALASSNTGHDRKQTSFDQRNKVQTFLGFTSTFFVSVFVFFLLIGASLAVVFIVSESQRNDRQDDATRLATDTGQYFSNQLDQAILPLFSLAQFALHLEIFQDLPNQIGQAGEPGALPFVTSRTDDRAYRNVTGVCDDLELVTRFVSIASGIKEHSQMGNILVNIQLAPAGVICLLHPMNNTEDFEAGMFLDSTGAWGLDLLNDPIMKFIALGSLEKEEVVVAGPMPLVQCPECGDFFIARLPIVDPKHKIIGLDGVAYPRWGFATALIDWTQMVNSSGILHSFRNGYGGQGKSLDQYNFQLTRTDREYNKTTETYDETVVILAESANFMEYMYDKNHRYVVVALETTDSEWEMKVGFSTRDIDLWTYVVTVVCVIMAFFFSWLVYTVLHQKQTHASMKAMTWAQEATVEAERNMTAYFAHELRNPLSAMDSALQTIDEDELPQMPRELIQGMKLCASFMSNIMNNLLDARKLQEGMMEFRSHPISLNELIVGIHQMMLPLVKPNVEFKLENNVPKSLDYVLGDLHRLQQVLANVITNAIKYTLVGSIILRCYWCDQSTNVCFEVEDTGPGIPKQEQERLFERFVQRGGAPGTGLGLAIAKEFVTMMGGRIRFESDPTIRPGTKCVVTLPLERCAPIDDYPKAPSLINDNEVIDEPIKILIIDDVKMNRTMLERRLKKAVTPNAEIIMAVNGEAALEIVRNCRFDIIICDQYMEEAGGVMVGTDVIIAMRREHVESLVVGCSGNDLNDEFHRAGADLVWGKPMPSNEEIIRQFRMGLRDRDLV